MANVGALRSLSPHSRTVTLPVASLPSGTEASGGFGTSSSRALSRLSIGAACCSSDLISSRIRRSASTAASSRFFAIAADRRFCSALSCSSLVTSSRRCWSSCRISSTGAGSPFLRAPSLTRSGCSRMKLRLSMPGAQVREQDHIADGGLVGQDGREPVDPQAHATRGWKAILERSQEVLVHRMGLIVTGRTRPRLVFEASPLIVRVVQLGEGIGDLLAGNEQLEAIRQPRITGSPPGEWRDFHRMSQDEGGLHQGVLHELLEQLGDQPAPAGPGLRLNAVFLDEPL